MIFDVLGPPNWIRDARLRRRQLRKNQRVDCRKGADSGCYVDPIAASLSFDATPVQTVVCKMAGSGG